MLKSSSHPPYTHHSSRRRRGQALLLAVLVMVFVSLIGATFITVVAINLGQTNRSEEKDKARQAAAAGLAFVNMQLTESVWGSQWRANDPAKGGANPPISNSDPTYYAYWTPFDQAQGWNTAGFTKFPDPRSQNPSFSTPNYLVKVEKVIGNPLPALRDPDNQDNGKTDALRITTIGLSPDDPATFYKTVAYKAGPAQSPLTSTMRSVSNWDFENGVVPSAATANTGSSSTTMTLKEVSGNFPADNFYVIISNPDGSNVRGAAVASRLGLTLTFATNQNWSIDDRVELAAGIGVPGDLDYDNDTTTPAIPINYQVSQGPTSGGMRINGGLFLLGNILANNLRSAPVSTLTAPASTIQVSGLVKRDAPTESFTIGGTTNFLSTGSSNGALEPTSTLALGSDISGFPGNWTDTSSAPLDAVEKDQIFSDGLYRITGTPGNTRQTKPFTPPDIAGRPDGLSRYRTLSKYSPDDSNDDAPGNDPVQSGAYGYGEGIYIPNVADKERIGTGAGAYKEMSQEELRNLWSNTGTTLSYYRTGTPDASNLDAKSLEEMHLRGWVGPAEFVPRGAFVEINDNNTLTITLDSRTDNTTGDLTRAQGAVLDKGWRDSDGNLLGISTNSVRGGVYRQTFNWPENGVLFAEGNIRIRGATDDPPRSLTVVSMNNIYIEGALNIDTDPADSINRRVLLLAKRNVVVNPTQVLVNPDGQTRLRETVTGSAVIPVQNSAAFEIGDWVSIEATAPAPEGCVIARAGETTADPSDDTITLSKPVNVTLNNPPQAVRVLKDPADATGLPYNNYANRLELFNQALNRHLKLPAGTTTQRIALRHSAQLLGALRVQFTQGAAPGARISAASLTNKRLPVPVPSTPQPTLIQSTDKHLRVEYTDEINPLGVHEFPPNPPGFADESAASAYDLNQLVNAMNTNPPGGPSWQYNASLVNNYGINTKVPPYFFLASVGNRYEWGTRAVGTYPWQKVIFPEPAPVFEVPMATSVMITANGVLPVTMRTASTTLGNEEVKQFGFSLTHALPLIDSVEDILTTDQYFYNNGATVEDDAKYTLDSRLLTGLLPNATNALAFKLNPAAEEFFNSAAANKIPYYRLSRLKLENMDVDTNGLLQNINPGYEFDIHAYAYAQSGSWFVIPSTYFDATVKRDLVDIPGVTTGEDLDLNRDDSDTRDESAAVYRFYRYNYQINFTGAIMEGRTAMVKTVGTIGPDGTVADWVDKWATTKLTDADFTGNTVNHSALSFGNQLNTINYQFDPLAATDGIDADLTSDKVGFRPPISPELLYQTG